MPFLTKLGFVLFGLFAVADITFLATDLNSYRYYTKPFLLPCLFLIIFTSSIAQKHPVSKLYLLVAFAAGTLGDILLLNDSNFVYGVGSFLIMQLFYCLYFFRMQGWKKDFALSNVFIALMLLGFGFVLIGFLYNHLGALKAPVTIYAVVILFMLFAAINVSHSKRAQKLAYRHFIPGASLLVLSDTILAINKFYLKDDLFDISVMVTYLLGQLFLTFGFVKHLKSSRHGRRRSHRSGNTDQLAASL